MAPFDMDAFFGDDLVAPLADNNPSFEVLAEESGLPLGWTMNWVQGILDAVTPLGIWKSVTVTNISCIGKWPRDGRLGGVRHH